MHLEFVECFRQNRAGIGGLSTAITIITPVVPVSIEAPVDNLISFKFNFRIINIIVVEEPTEEAADVVVFFIQRFICNNIVGNLKILQHSFNNFK